METFVVRVWTARREPEDEPSSFHGVVEHVRSGGSRVFGGPEQLLDFLRSALTDPRPRPERGDVTDTNERIR
jgi:hypothetical protein